MGRPKRALTPGKAHSAGIYYRRLLERFTSNDKTLKTLLVQKEGLDGWDLWHKAMEALKALPEIHLYRKDSVTGEYGAIPAEEEKPACDAFRAWLDEYITEAGWRRFLANERQEDFKRDKRPRAIKLSQGTYISLKIFAEDKSLTLDAAVATLVRYPVQVSEDTYYGLKRWAEKHSRTPADVIAELLRQAEEREALASTRR